ncbi:hypothetical protein AVEN_48644-1 [Araneus ventricosus]|uniref:Uncharacterized protein n=1 Tax=Araneus ventricosus TaxID=182803 RepID=A0A4Y2S8K2_ARAVE|nr:hypothetical protein AVEN_48644-1 [Araneus ventricosus]
MLIIYDIFDLILQKFLLEFYGNAEVETGAVLPRRMRQTEKMLEIASVPANGIGMMQVARVTPGRCREHSAKAGGRSSDTVRDFCNVSHSIVWRVGRRSTSPPCKSASPRYLQIGATCQLGTLVFKSYSAPILRKSTTEKHLTVKVSHPNTHTSIAIYTSLSAARSVSA